MSIEKMLSACEEDTHRFVNYGAASRMSGWRRCDSEQERVQFIKGAIRNRSNQANGFAIHLNGGTSLEMIVLSYPELFSDEDYELAESRLGEY